MSGVNSKFRVFLLLFLMLMAVAATAGEQNVLLLRNGAVVLAHTGQYDKEFSPATMLEGDLGNYWASSTTRFPLGQHIGFIIELRQTYLLDRLVVDNREIDEEAFPGVSARRVSFSASTQSSSGPWKVFLTMEAKRFGRKEEQLEKPTAARWLKVEVLSNYGDVSYTEINELEAYGTPTGKAPEPQQANGVYLTNYGPLLLKVNGSRFEGCYEIDTGYVYGSTDGRVFDMNWIEHRGEERGTALLALSSKGLLSGLWYEDDIMKGPWFGNRLEGKAKIDCDPASAAAHVGYKPEP